VTDYELHIHARSETAQRRITAEPDQLAAAVHRHVRGLLGGSVDVQLDGLAGTARRGAAHLADFTLAVIPEPTATDAADEGGIKWGYTLADLQYYARAAARNARFFSLVAWHDYYEEALSAIFMHLVAADEAPHRSDLLRAADTAIIDLVRGRRRDHGYREADGDDRIKWQPQFFRYWTPGAGTDLAERTTERLAVWQILDALWPDERAAVEALAACGHYDTAAQSLGISVACLKQRLHLARRRFLRLWHSPETPGPRWQQDRRRATNPAKSVCGNGHDYSNPENVGHRTTGKRRGQRYCKACSRASSARSKAGAAA
jgi:DNA-directed RNA polymerase specialized sigma24 family protein